MFDFRFTGLNKTAVKFDGGKTGTYLFPAIISAVVVAATGIYQFVIRLKKSARRVQINNVRVSLSQF